MSIDLKNNPAPGGSALVTVTAAAFKKWMKRCGYQAGDANVNQEVFFIYPKTISPGVTPSNWHITAMTTLRDGGDCRNYHFKLEFGKECSHYWHYVIYRHGVTGALSWVGDPNPLLPGTNEGGGGAGNNAQLLLQNRTAVESLANQQGFDSKCTQRIQRQMLVKLQQMITGQILTYAGNRIT